MHILCVFECTRADPASRKARIDEFFCNQRTALKRKDDRPAGRYHWRTLLGRRRGGRERRRWRRRVVGSLGCLVKCDNGGRGSSAMLLRSFTKQWRRLWRWSGDGGLRCQVPFYFQILLILLLLRLSSSFFPCLFTRVEMEGVANVFWLSDFGVFGWSDFGRDGVAYLGRMGLSVKGFWVCRVRIVGKGSLDLGSARRLFRLGEVLGFFFSFFSWFGIGESRRWDCDWRIEGCGRWLIVRTGCWGRGCEVIGVWLVAVGDWWVGWVGRRSGSGDGWVGFSFLCIRRRGCCFGTVEWGHGGLWMLVWWGWNDRLPGNKNSAQKPN